MLLKKSVVDPMPPLAGMEIPNCDDVAAIPRGIVTGVARKSATTAERISTDAVCSIAR